MAEGDRWIELAEGDEFAGYRIERRLGRGGMGILYLAVEPGLERRVALKLIAPEAAADEVFGKRFAEESKIAASIEHPNVVPIYAAGEEGSVPYIAMRYVSGSDLGRRVAREGRLDSADAVALIAQVGNGLDAIHAAGLVHRDVKPANVLLSGGEASDHAYITDFGVARNVATNSGLTQTGRFVGTLDYVAPEQISGGEIDARVDVYALGCLLFKLLTGEVPYPRDGEAARLYAHLNDPPPAPSLFVPEVSMALDDVVIRAMSKHADDRYPSAGDLGRAATAALSGGPVTVPEHTVATGAAATRTAVTIGATETGGEVEGSPSSDEPTSATRRLPPEPAQARRERGSGVRRPRRWMVPAGLVAVVAIVGGAIALGGAGGGDSGAGANPGGGSKASSKQELISKANAICLDSQRSFLRAKQEFPQGETSPIVDYSRILAGISSRELAGFDSLKPPPAVAGSFEQYAEAQRRVHRYDVEALRAAERGNSEAYLAARERRNGEQGERYDLARKIGLKQCSKTR